RRRQHTEDDISRLQILLAAAPSLFEIPVPNSLHFDHTLLRAVMRFHISDSSLRGAVDASTPMHSTDLSPDPFDRGRIAIVIEVDHHFSTRSVHRNPAYQTLQRDRDVDCSFGDLFSFLSCLADTQTCCLQKSDLGAGSEFSFLH